MCCTSWYKYSKINDSKSVRQDAAVMMIKLGLLLAGVAAFCAAKNVTLSGDKWEWVIVNWSGFNLWRQNTTWTINTDSDSTIKVYCPVMDIGNKLWDPETSCNNAKLAFDDGVKNKTEYCSPHTDVLFEGNSSKVEIDFSVKPNSGGVFFCQGKSVHPPRSYKTIDVAVGSRMPVKLLEKDSDQAFLFNSISGSPITLNCTRIMEPPLSSGACVKDVLTINAGNLTDVSCGNGEVSAIGRQIKMRVETYQDTESRVSCVVSGYI